MDQLVLPLGLGGPLGCFQTLHLDVGLVYSGYLPYYDANQLNLTSHNKIDLHIMVNQTTIMCFIFSHLK